MAAAEQCANCGIKPMVRLVTEADQEPDYSHVLEHNEPTCPNGLQTWQNSRQDCVSNWNNHNMAFRGRK